MATPPSTPIQRSRSAPRHSLSSWHTASTVDDADGGGDDDDVDVNEVYELQEHQQHHHHQCHATPHGPAVEKTVDHAVADTWAERVRHFWATRVDVVVDIRAARDHLGEPRNLSIYCPLSRRALINLARVSAALERTFLGYLRTAAILSMTGVLIAQILILSPPPASAPTPRGFGAHSIGKPLATAFLALAMATVLLGAGRAYGQQRGLVEDRMAMAGGAVLVGVGTAVFVVSRSIGNSFSGSGSGRTEWSFYAVPGRRDGWADDEVGLCSWSWPRLDSCLRWIWCRGGNGGWDRKGAGLLRRLFMVSHVLEMS